MITVRVPSILRSDGWPPDVVIDGPVTTIEALVSELDRRLPGARARLDDPLFNFAVNDAMILHGVHTHRLRDGDVVEIIPTIAGG
jgi:molybdopterin converting factor small subunit